MVVAHQHTYVLHMGWDVGIWCISISDQAPDCLLCAGKVSQQGTSAGTGYTINLPLPGGAGHEAMQMVLDQVIRPAAHRFKPDIVLVSAGDLQLVWPYRLSAAPTVCSVWCKAIRQCVMRACKCCVSFIASSKCKNDTVLASFQLCCYDLSLSKRR